MRKNKKQKFKFPEVKKTLKWWVIVIIAALVCAIFHVSMSRLYEPHFKITKEECRNETRINEKTEKVLGELNELYRDFYGKKCDETCECESLSEPCLKIHKEIILLEKKLKYIEGTWTYKKQICEQVEVDKIIGGFGDRSECSEDFYDCGQTCLNYNFKECEEECRQKYCEKKEIIILKKDLDKDFLSENCECISYSCKPKLFWNSVCSYQEKDCWCENKMQIFEEIRRKGNLYCQKYKCGDYYVETWRQIK